MRNDDGLRDARHTHRDEMQDRIWDKGSQRQPRPEWWRARGRWQGIVRVGMGWRDTAEGYQLVCSRSASELRDTYSPKRVTYLA